MPFLAQKILLSLSIVVISFKGLGRAVSESITGSRCPNGWFDHYHASGKKLLSKPLSCTLKRKLTEIFLARRIEQNLTKEEILNPICQ